MEAWSYYASQSAAFNIQFPPPLAMKLELKLSSGMFSFLLFSAPVSQPFAGAPCSFRATGIRKAAEADFSRGCCQKVCSRHKSA
jgi:hypothetical protein